MHRRMVRIFAVIAIVATGVPSWAQITAGNIRGVVTDESGAPLPGVTATLRGERVAGAPTTVTNEVGVYRFGTCRLASTTSSSICRGSRT